jgi:hypothetical protein
MKFQQYPIGMIGCITCLAIASLSGKDAAVSGLYEERGSDPTFQELVEQGKLPEGKNTKAGVTGSSVKVNHKNVEILPEAKRPIPREIKLHTLLNSSIPRSDFGNWTRWYQEDGNTQIFRLFKGEENRRNERELAGRVEAFSMMNWTEADGKWHEWSGVVTAIKPTGSIFQIKSTIEGPAMMMMMNEEGDLIFNPRRGKDITVAQKLIGKPFHLRVLDNGKNYEVFFNEKKVGEGLYDRPKSPTSFRWGMYVGANPIRYDAMILFSGVTFKEVK